MLERVMAGRCSWACKAEDLRSGELRPRVGCSACFALCRGGKSQEPLSCSAIIATSLGINAPPHTGAHVHATREAPPLRQKAARLSTPDPPSATSLVVVVLLLLLILVEYNLLLLTFFALHYFILPTVAGAHIVWGATPMTLRNLEEVLLALG